MIQVEGQCPGRYRRRHAHGHNPKILYLGTPVVLISTMNQDGSVNLAPMSSAWWLGLTGVLGLGTRAKLLPICNEMESAF